MKSVVTQAPTSERAMESPIASVYFRGVGAGQLQYASGQRTPRSQLKAMGFLKEDGAAGEAMSFCAFDSPDQPTTWFVPANSRRIERVLQDEEAGRSSGLRGMRRRLPVLRSSSCAQPETQLCIPFALERLCPSVCRENTLIEVRQGIPVISLHLHDAKARALGVVRCARGGDGRGIIENERLALDYLSSLSLRSARTPQVLGKSEAGVYSLLFISSLSPRSVPVPRRFTVAHQQFLDELEYRTRPSGLASVTLRECLVPAVVWLERNAEQLGLLRYPVVERICDTLRNLPEFDIPSGLGHGAFEPRHARLLNGELLVSGWQGAGQRRALSTDLIRFELALSSPSTPPHKQVHRLAAAIATQWPALTENGVWAVLALSVLEILADQCRLQAEFLSGSGVISHQLLGEIEKRLRP